MHWQALLFLSFLLDAFPRLAAGAAGALLGVKTDVARFQLSECRNLPPWLPCAILVMSYDSPSSAHTTLICTTDVDGKMAAQT